MALPVFKTGEAESLGLAGSIPVRLRHLVHTASRRRVATSHLVGAGVRSPLVLGAFAEELEADVPQIVTAVHVAGIGASEFLWAGAGAGLFHDHVGGSLAARLEQPGVVGQPLVCLAVPADAGPGSNSWTVLWMCAPKVIQSNVMPPASTCPTAV